MIDFFLEINLSEGMKGNSALQINHWDESHG